MTRKTKAQLNQEFEQQRLAQLEEAKANYQPRLMNLLGRASSERWTITVTNEGLFVVEDYSDELYKVGLNFTENFDVQLDFLESELQIWEHKRAEAQRMAEVRATAMNKLTNEEKQALGL